MYDCSRKIIKAPILQCQEYNIMFIMHSINSLPNSLKVTISRYTDFDNHR